MGVCILLIRKQKQSSGWSNFLSLLPVFILVNICLTPILYAQSISEESLPPLITLMEISNMLELIEKNFRETDTIQVQEGLNSIRHQLDTFLKQTGRLPADQDRVAALQNRINLLEGAFNYYINRKSDARKAFLELLQRSPDATLDGSMATPVLAQFFESIREQIVGFLSVSSTPVASTVSIEDTMLGTTPLLGTYIIAGNYTVRIEHKGYQYQDVDITIEPGKEVQVTVSLDKISGSCRVMTSPPDVNILIDDILQGTTEGTLLSNPERYAEYIAQAEKDGLDPGRISEPKLVDYISLGEHTISFESKCYKKATYRIHVELGEYFLPPVVLEPDFGILDVQSEPAGSLVKIDGESIGRTPLTLDPTCAGTQNIHIEMNSPSNWFDTITIPTDKKVSIRAVPRPTILFLGCAGTDQTILSDANQRISGWLNETVNFNRVPEEVEKRCRIRPVVASIMEQLATCESYSEINWVTLLEILPVTLNDVNARLYAIAKINTSGMGTPSTLFLIYPGMTKPDILEFPPDQPPVDIPQSVRSILESNPLIARYWLGLNIVEHKGALVIVGVDNSGPAVTLPVKPGNRLTAINGKQIHSMAEYLHFLEDRSLNPELTLTVLQGKIKRKYTVKAQFEPVMLPLSDPSVHYNLALARISELSIIPQMESASFLNAGICYLALGDPESALSRGFSKCQLDEKPGISKGTLAFLKALVLKRRGLTDQSMQEARIALHLPYSRIVDPDGPNLNQLVKTNFQ
jgi:PEGA domain/PDZ domain